MLNEKFRKAEPLNESTRSVRLNPKREAFLNS